MPHFQRTRQSTVTCNCIALPLRRWQARHSLRTTQQNRGLARKPKAALQQGGPAMAPHFHPPSRQGRYCGTCPSYELVPYRTAPPPPPSPDSRLTCTEIIRSRQYLQYYLATAVTDSSHLVYSELKSTHLLKLSPPSLRVIFWRRIGVVACKMWPRGHQISMSISSPSGPGYFPIFHGVSEPGRAGQLGAHPNHKTISSTAFFFVLVRFPV